MEIGHIHAEKGGNNNPKRTFRGLLRSYMKPENAAEKKCKDDICYKIIDLFSRDTKVDRPLWIVIGSM